MDLIPTLYDTLSLIAGQTWALLPLFGLLYVRSTPRYKGWRGEQQVRKRLARALDREKYHCLHDILMPTADGSAQIDHVVVSEYGVFVIETKHMSGWIFGGKKQAQWTQKLYRNTYRFQNPLRQNYGHKKTLEILLDLQPEQVFSLVVFTGNGIFKTPMPDNVTTLAGCIEAIQARQVPALSDKQVRNCLYKIDHDRMRATRQERRRHVAMIKSRLATRS